LELEKKDSEFRAVSKALGVVGQLAEERKTELEPKRSAFQEKACLQLDLQQAISERKEAEMQDDEDIKRLQK